MAIGAGSGTVRSAAGKTWFIISNSRISVENPSGLSVRHEIDQFNTRAARPSRFDVIRDIHLEAVKNKLKLVKTSTALYTYIKTNGNSNLRRVIVSLVAYIEGVSQASIGEDDKYRRARKQRIEVII